MKKIVNAAQMKQIDMTSITSVGIPSVVLMERAALAVTDRILAAFPKPVPVLVLAGTGNNGADGLAVARQLREHGYAARAAFLGDPEKATAEWKLQHKILTELQIPVTRVTEDHLETLYCGEAVIVDAIFGIGLVREVGGLYRAVIEQANASPAYRVAVDIPSGLSADSGRVLGIAFAADETVTFGCLKLGLALYPGKEIAGSVTTADIGFPASVIDSVPAEHVHYEACDLLPLAKRPAYSNKGTFGCVLIFAGSRNMAGAACFAAKAAIAMGCGLVRVLTVEENRQILQTAVPEAVLSTYDPEAPDYDAILAHLKWADVLAAGPGLSTDPKIAQVLAFILENCEGPKVLDADALNLLAKNPGWKVYLNENTILTPHLGELARLTGKKIPEIAADVSKAAREAAAEFGCTVIAKDAVSMTASPGAMTAVNVTGNQGMACGGSGDVLTGIAAGMLTVESDAARAAGLAAYLHGMAGDLARDSVGAHAMGPKDMIEAVGRIWLKLEREL